MKSNYIFYDFEKSRERIDDILRTDDKSFEEVDKIPSRDRLTYNNGFYVNKTSALFVDIRDSSLLPSKYKRPVLARIYRSYISEVVAAINGNSLCTEINIHGDSVWGVFDAQYMEQLDRVLETAGKIASIVDIINCKLVKKDIDPIVVGIGLSWGRVLMIKAGYNGSGINDVVWMGDVVNESSNLCSFGSKTNNDYRIMVSENFYGNIKKQEYKDLLIWNANRKCYHGAFVNSVIDKWINENNCK